MADIYIPTLHTFAMKNLFTGSYGSLRFRIKPDVVMATPKEVDFDQSTMFVEYWHGLYCYEKSEMEGSETFPLTDAGREEMIRFLKSKI